MNGSQEIEDIPPNDPKQKEGARSCEKTFKCCNTRVIPRTSV